jgi:hypothetical protein
MIALQRINGSSANSLPKSDSGIEVWGPVADEVAHQRAERPLAVVALLGVEPRRLPPGDAGTDDRSEDLPDQRRQALLALLVEEVLQPGVELPLAAVQGVDDDRAVRVLAVVHVALGREHQGRVEREKRLGLEGERLAELGELDGFAGVVEDAVVHGDQVAVGALGHPRSTLAQLGHDLLEPAVGQRNVVVLGYRQEVVLAGGVGAQIRVLGIDLVHGQHVAGLVDLVLTGLDAHHVVQAQQHLGDLPVGELLQPRQLLAGFLGLGVLRAHDRIDQAHEPFLHERRGRGVLRVQGLQVGLGHVGDDLVVRSHVGPRGEEVLDGLHGVHEVGLAGGGVHGGRGGLVGLLGGEVLGGVLEFDAPLGLAVAVEGLVGLEVVVGIGYT